MRNSPKHCIWLTFESELLDSIIYNLSKKYKSPIFQPHCTLIGRTDIPLIQLKSAIVSLNNDNFVSEVSMGGIRYRDEYWMSYYLTISENTILNNLHNNLIEILNLKDSSNYLPHVSLMYNSMKESKKKSIILPIQKGDVFRTKSIQITECEGTVESWKPVFELLI